MARVEGTPIDQEKYDRLYRVVCDNVWEYNLPPRRDGREMQVAYRYALDGWSQANIADMLHISSSSVEYYWKRLGDRLMFSELYYKPLTSSRIHHARHMIKNNLRAAYWIAVGQERAHD